MSKWEFRFSTTEALKLKLPETQPSSMHWTVQLILPRILSFFPANDIFLHCKSVIFKPNSETRRWSINEDVGVGKYDETITANGRFLKLKTYSHSLFPYSYFNVVFAFIFVGSVCIFFTHSQSEISFATSLQYQLSFKCLNLTLSLPN